MKPTARLGDTHLCPAHGPNPIVQVASRSTCDGIPVATVGDVTACGAVIVTGSPQSTTDGKPTARIGSDTNHGGKIITGSPTQMIP